MSTYVFSFADDPDPSAGGFGVGEMVSSAPVDVSDAQAISDGVAEADAIEADLFDAQTVADGVASTFTAAVSESDAATVAEVIAADSVATLGKEDDDAVVLALAAGDGIVADGGTVQAVALGIADTAATVTPETVFVLPIAVIGNHADAALARLSGVFKGASQSAPVVAAGTDSAASVTGAPGVVQPARDVATVSDHTATALARLSAVFAQASQSAPTTVAATPAAGETPGEPPAQSAGPLRDIVQITDHSAQALARFGGPFDGAA